MHLCAFVSRAQYVAVEVAHTTDVQMVRVSGAHDVERAHEPNMMGTSNHNVYICLCMSIYVYVCLYMNMMGTSNHNEVTPIM